MRWCPSSARAVAVLLAAVVPASCSGGDGLAVNGRSENGISIDYNTAHADREAMQKTAEAHCQHQSNRHARQTGTDYLRGGSGSEVWWTATYDCVP